MPLPSGGLTSQIPHFSELDGRRLARLFCFFLNFSYIFAEYSDSYIVNICGILIFKIAITQWRIRLSQFLWECYIIWEFYSSLTTSLLDE